MKHIGTSNTVNLIWPHMILFYDFILFIYLILFIFFAINLIQLSSKPLYLNTLTEVMYLHNTNVRRI